MSVLERISYGRDALMEDNRQLSENVMDARETQPDGGVDVPDITGDVVGALRHLEPGKPLILNDGFVIADSGYMVTSRYVDTGMVKLRRRPSTLVKLIDAEYGLELAANLLALLIPVAWGALGACTALAKRVSDRLAEMSYEENRLQGLPARVFLGAALALVLDILVFVEGAAPAEDAPTLGLGPIAAALLAGLLVQHIYGALETMMRRVSRAISPETPAPRAEPPAGEQPRDR